MKQPTNQPTSQPIHQPTNLQTILRKTDILVWLWSVHGTLNNWMSAYNRLWYSSSLGIFQLGDSFSVSLLCDSLTHPRNILSMIILSDEQEGLKLWNTQLPEEKRKTFLETILIYFYHGVSLAQCWPNISISYKIYI